MGGEIHLSAGKIGCSGETLRNWARQSERERTKALERDNRELRQANETLQGERLFCDSGVRSPTPAMIAFVDHHRAAYGLEPICKALLIAPSMYYAHVNRRTDSDKQPARTEVTLT